LMDILQRPQHQANSPLAAIPIAEMVPQSLPSHVMPLQADMIGFSNAPMGSMHGQINNLPPVSSPSASLSWDSWITMSSTLVPASPFTAAHMNNIHTSDTPDLLAQMLNTSHSTPDPPGQQPQWPTPTSGTCNVRKRRKTQEELDHQDEENGPSPLSEFLVSGQELPFHLIS
jgi:hypothetical protein